MNHGAHRRGREDRKKARETILPWHVYVSLPEMAHVSRRRDAVARRPLLVAEEMDKSGPSVGGDGDGRPPLRRVVPAPLGAPGSCPSTSRTPSAGGAPARRARKIRAWFGGRQLLPRLTVVENNGLSMVRPGKRHCTNL